MSSCVTGETADVSVSLTRRGWTQNAVYTAGDIDLHPHVTHSHSQLRAVTRAQETPTRATVGFSDLIRPLYKNCSDKYGNIASGLLKKTCLPKIVQNYTCQCPTQRFGDKYLQIFEDSIRHAQRKILLLKACSFMIMEP